MTKLNNPPAFPVSHKDYQKDSERPDGMTLLDYFAAKAMQGMLVGRSTPPYRKAAQDAYAMAQCMLDEREKYT